MGQTSQWHGRLVLIGGPFEAGNVTQVRIRQQPHPPLGLRGADDPGDVYYRLNVIALHLPPLRERRDDIPLLAHRFLDSLAEREGEKALADEALDVLCAYDWPGNVRELENALERAAVVTPNQEISVGDLPDDVRATDAKPLVTDQSPSNPSMELIERAYIQFVLTAEGGDKSKAAEVLGIDPSTLCRKLNRYGIEV